MKLTRICAILPVLLIAIVLFNMAFSNLIWQLGVDDVQNTEPDEASEMNFRNETRAEDFQYLGTRNLGGNTQYGSVYNRYYKEYWIKQSWSSSTIYRYNDAGNYLGTKNTVSHSIALGTDSDGNLYVGDNSRTFYKYDRNGNQVWARSYNDGSQARGITCDDRYVYGLFNYGPILKLDKNTGAKVGLINPTRGFTNAFSLLYFNHMLIVSDSDHELLVYDMNGQYLRTIDPPYNSGSYGIAWTGRELQACEHSRNTWYRYSAVDLLVYTENAALIDDEGEEDENICYARYKPYTFSVNLTTNENVNDVSELKVHLDYNTTNATLGYNWSRNEFFKLHDNRGDVQLLLDNCTTTDDGVERVWVNFSVIFNFTFPHERPIDCFTNTSSVADEHTIDRFPHLFRVENDMELVGLPHFTGEFQGALSEGDWIRGNENLTVSDLRVRYAGSADKYPDDSHFDVRIADRSGNTWWDNESSGVDVGLELRARDVTDPDEEYVITIENIPGTGICTTNLSYPLKTDADAPLPPQNVLCRADSFRDRETQTTDRPEMYVTWDEVADAESGLLGYYCSGSDNSGTGNGSFTNETQMIMDRLDEGYAPVYLWCVDNVGNIGGAESSGIQVDLTPPVFADYTPVDGAWHNKSKVLCTVEVSDPEGSGVDGSTVEYSVSAGGRLNYETWMPAGLVEADIHLSPSVEYYFPEGTENYIKWRAKDISGNGYAESLPTNVKVDITPVKFEDGISPNDAWYDRKDITTSIRLSDTGSGVDPSSVRVRTSRSGPNGFGSWRPVPQENVTEVENGVFEITVTRYYEEGKDNYVVFRGTDLAGNPYGISREFNLKIDTSPVYFRAFSPDNESYSSEKKVECSIYLWDDGTGVDAGSVEYSISAKGVGEENYGNWKKVPNVFPGNPAQVIIEVGFEWGRDNYIRFRANDVIGTGYNVSGEYMVWVNSEPAPEISSPVNGEEFPEGAEILFNASLSWDMDGDELSYYWTSNVTANRSLGHGSHFSARLVPGKHAITLHVSDGHGNNISKKLLLTIKEKEKVPEKTARDIITGKGGLNFFWLIFIIAAFVIVVLAILVIFIVVRKKKKDPKEEGPTPVYNPPFAPEHRPYPKGQYMPRIQQGYTGLASPGYATGVSPGQLMLPPGKQVMPPMASTARMQFPRQDTGVQPGSSYTAGNTFPPATSSDTSFTLPAFSTGQGTQEPGRLALPPAPDTFGAVAPVIPTNAPGAVPSAIPANAPDTLGAVAPVIPTNAPGAVLPAMPANVPGDRSTGPSVLENAAGIVPPTEPENAFSFESTAPPVPETPAADIAPIAGLPPLPGGLSPEPAPLPGSSGPTESSMQCHACGHVYSVTIIELPAVVTCPVCHTQGMIA